MARASRSSLLRSACCALLALTLCGFQSRTKEYEVKAAFMYHFTKFVEFPADSRGAVVGVLGSDPFGSHLDSAFSGKRIGASIAEVRRISTVAEAKACRLVFIAASEEARLASILSDLHGQPILTVSDSPGFAKRGVMINMFLEGGKVRFEINQEVARSARIGISSRLLSLAREPK